VSVRHFGAQLVLASARGTLHSLRSRKARLNDASPGCVTGLRKRPECLGNRSRLNRCLGRCRRSLYGSGDHDLANVDVEFAQTLGEDAHEFDFAAFSSATPSASRSFENLSA